MSVRLFVSVTAERAASLTAVGPRRDFVEIAKATGGQIVYAPSAGGSGSARRLARTYGRRGGPHADAARGTACSSTANTSACRRWCFCVSSAVGRGE